MDMKVVIHRYNSICEPGYIDAFKALGIDVVEDCLEMTEKNIPADVRISTIAELILKNKPMFVFSINFFPYISDICERLHVMYVCVSVDCPVTELWSTAVRNDCNRIFLFDRMQYLEVADENPGHIFHMPLGVNPLIKAQETGDFKYDVSFIGSLYNEKNPYADMADALNPRVRGLCEGLLAAQEMLPGQELLEAVIRQDEAGREIISEFNKYTPSAVSGIGETIGDIGAFWTVNACLGTELTVRDRLILLSSIAESITDLGSLHLFTRSDTSLLSSVSPHTQVHGGISTLTEMPQVISSSRININTTMRPIRSGLPQRIWDVLGCGGFLLTNAQAEIPEYLVPGTHLEVFESPEEACEKVRYYLTHEDERLAIARAGYEEAVLGHTIAVRVKDMITMIMQGISPEQT
ncbi:MAG: glycosyltransferase [Lachnospiraceae bacterium]|nr:glycosyltransferase [Lachnospiraceae bacterium]